MCVARGARIGSEIGRTPPAYAITETSLIQDRWCTRLFRSQRTGCNRMTDDPSLTLDQADAFAGIALGHVTREYPNKLDHVLAVAEDALTPRALHPVFYGSFDWHSCVHGYWMLSHLYR